MRQFNAIMLLALCAMLGVAGCFQGPGGGGTTHVPPTSAPAGQPITLQMSFSVWGAGTGNLSRRYTEIYCHYRSGQTGAYLALPMTIISSNDTEMQTTCTIPGNEVRGSEIQYYLDFNFDGIANTVQTPQNPYSIAITGG